MAVEPSAAEAPSLEGVSPRLIRKNLWSIGITYAVSGLAGFAAQAYLARRLGRSVFGVYIAAAALVAIVRVIDRLGRTEYLVREVSRDRSRLPGLVGDMLFLKFVATVAGAAVAIGAAAALGFPSTGVALAGLLAFMAGADGMTDAFRAGLQSMERLEVVAVVSSAVSVLSAAGMVVAVAVGWGVVGAVALSAGVSAAAIPAAWIVLRREIPIRFRASLVVAARLVRDSLPFAAVGVLTFAVGYVDALVIRGVLGHEATGIYGAAYRIIVVLGWIALTFQSAVYRTMSHLAHSAKVEFARFVERSAAGMFLLGLPFAVGGSFLAGPVLRLVFGPQYTAGTDAFRILLWSLPFAFTGLLLMSAVMVEDRPQRAGWALAVAFAGNLGLNIALVPDYGIEAAAWVTVGTEAFLVVAAAFILRRQGVALRWETLALPGLLAGALEAAVVFPLRHAPLVAPLVAGTCVYAAALLAMGVPGRLGLNLRRHGRRG